MFGDVYTKEYGSVACAKAAVDVNRFCDRLFLNGSIQIVDAETGEMIGRKDPYLPLNMRYIAREAAAQATQLDAEVARRQRRDEKYGEEIDRLSATYSAYVTVAFGKIA
jgi:hypothetical protein